MIPTNFSFLLSLALIQRTKALLDPDSTSTLVSLFSQFDSNGDAGRGTVFFVLNDSYTGSITGESENLFDSDSDSDSVVSDGVATIDARSGKLANLDLSVPILPGDGHGNHLLWSVGLTDSPDVHGAPATAEEWAAIGITALDLWIASHQHELRIDASELFVSSGDDQEPTVRTGVYNDGDMIQFSLERRFKGVEVVDSRLSATIKAGNLMNLGFEKWGDIPTDFDVDPRISWNEACHVLSESAGVELADGETCEPVLQILTMEKGRTPSFVTGNKPHRAKPNKNIGKGYRHALVWKICPIFQGQTNEMYEAYIDAATSAIYSLRDTVEYFNVKGDVYPNSPNGIGLDGVLQKDWPMPFAQVGTEVTDTGGNYFRDGSQVARLYGPYVDMKDKCGDESLTQSRGVDWGGAGAGTDCETPGYGGNTHASRTSFYELNRIMEIARSHLPSNSWLKKRLTVVTNIDETCNAFWDGKTINFFIKGTSTCSNTGELAGVIDHEWGHGLDHNDVAKGISAPSGEGIADVYSALRLNDSCIGRGFPQSVCNSFGNICTSCTGVRDIDYLKRKRMRPSTYTWARSNCNDKVHCLGYVYSEAVWSLYKRKLQSEPYNYDDNTALEIVMRLTYIGAGNVQVWYTGPAPFGGCGTSGYRQYLLADDDDGDLENGTPHMKAIYDAFNDQEIACSTPTVKDSGCVGTPLVAPVVSAAAGDMHATLSWNAISGVSNYQVFRTEGVKGCGQGKVLLGTLSSSTLSYNSTGLQNGREYYFIVIPKGPKPSCFGPASSCITVIPSERPPSKFPTAHPTPAPTALITPAPTARPTPAPSARQAKAQRRVSKLKPSL